MDAAFFRMNSLLPGTDGMHFQTTAKLNPPFPALHFT